MFKNKYYKINKFQAWENKKKQIFEPSILIHYYFYLFSASLNLCPNA